jgi:diguanylate cyclase (GGDEF)-like protein/PAS domain S-box-containing protein
VRTVRQIGRPEYVSAIHAESANHAGENAWQRPRAVGAIVLFSSILILIVALVAATHILSRRDAVIADHQRELKNIALILAESTGREFHTLDHMLQQLIARLSGDGLQTTQQLRLALSGPDVHAELKNAIIGVPFVSQIGLFESEGRLVNLSDSWPAPAIDLSDRAHFRELKSQQHLQFVLSEPMRSRTSDAWVLAFARKIVNTNGDVLGVLGGTVELSHFERFFGSVTLDGDASIAMARSDGILLVRHPRIESIVGQDFSGKPGLRDILGDQDSREVRMTSPADGKDRLIAARKVKQYPLDIAVTGTAGSALAKWRGEAAIIAALASGIVLAIVLGALFSIRHLARVQHRSDRAIEEHKSRLTTALDNMSQGLCMFDGDLRLILCNQRYLEMYNLPPEIVKPGCPLAEIIEQRKKTRTFEGDTASYVEEIGALIARGETASRLVEAPDGRIIRLIHQPMPGGSWVATHEDITVQRRAEEERDRNREFLNLVVENIPVTMVVKDAHDLRYIFVNRAGERYFGTSRDEIIGKTPHDLLPTASAQLVVDLDRKLLAADRGPVIDEHQIRMANGVLRTARSTRLSILGADGEPQYLLSVIEDITERKRAEERIAHLAHHDALTGLPNRVLFRTQLELALNQLREDEHLALLYLDIDHFKSINDTLGHPIGDELMRAVADRLRRCIAPGDSVARLGGDEFALIHTAIRNPQDCIPLLNKIYNAIRAPYELGGHHVVADVSIGIAIAPGDGTEPDELLKNADLALYGAKAEGRGTYRFFELDMDARMKERRSLELDLRKAIANGEFELYYQPIQNIAQGKVVGCEALIRWHHPEHGLIPPAEFIPVAEETGLINPIGEWVLRQACADASGWPDDLKVAVNLSPVQFRSRSLVQTIFNAFASAGLRPDRLELEITETVLMQHTEATIEVLNQLNKIGVRIAIDDFGTGFSSLGYLRSFPISKLKIDRTFIRDLPDDTDALAIVRAVVGLANSLDIVSTAEGVETEQQLAALRTMGCSEMQGYLLSPPRPLKEVAKLFPSSTARVVNAA